MRRTLARRAAERPHCRSYRALAVLPAPPHRAPGPVIMTGRLHDRGRVPHKGNVPIAKIKYQSVLHALWPASESLDVTSGQTESLALPAFCTLLRGQGFALLQTATCVLWRRSRSSGAVATARRAMLITRLVSCAHTMIRVKAMLSSSGQQYDTVAHLCCNSLY